MDGQTLAAAIALSRGSGGGSFAPDINDPQDGDTLVYDASEEKWVNGSGGGSGGAFIASVVFGDSDTHLDKTAGEIVSAIEAGKIVYAMQDDSLVSPEYGYTSYTYRLLKQYKYHNNTGTEEAPNTYWEFVFGIDTYTAYNSPTNYPVMAD